MLDRQSASTLTLDYNKGLITAEQVNKELMKQDWVQDPAFLHAIKGVLSGKRPGNATNFLFTSGNFVDWEHESPKLKLYYPMDADAGLILTHRGYYRDLAASLRRDGEPLIVIELGPGTAGKSKTIPFLNIVDPDIYYAADNSAESALTTLAQVHEARPDIAGRLALTPNFNALAMNHFITAQGPRLMVQFGSTLGNMQGALDGPMPYEGVKGALINYRHHLKEGDYLVLSVDQNRNKKYVRACYSEALHRKLAEGLLYRAEDELPGDSNFFAHNFSYTGMWSEENHLYAHCFRVQNDHSLYIDGEEIQLKKGQLLPYANSYKYPQEFLDAIYPQARFHLVDILPDPREFMHHHVLQAIP